MWGKTKKQRSDFIESLAEKILNTEFVDFLELENNPADQPITYREWLRHENPKDVKNMEKEKDLGAEVAKS